MILNVAMRALVVVVLIAAVSAAAPRKRSVEMAITLPNGAVARAAAPEDEGVMVTLADGTRFGFVPALSRDDSAIVVSIWDVDAQPMKKLGTVRVAVGGDEVRSDTSPVFGVRITRVVKPR